MLYLEINTNKFRVGQKIIFLRNIRSGYENEHVLLIPANEVCEIVKINNSHVTVMYGNEKIKLRYIAERMAPAGKLTEAIFGA